MIIKFDEYIIKVEKKQIKSIRLRILRSGEIKLSVPNFLSEQEMLKFLDSKLLWLKECKKNNIYNKNYYDFVVSNKVKIFGESYEIINILGDKNSYVIMENKLIITTQTVLSLKNLEDYVKKILKEILEKEIVKELQYFENKIGLFSSGFCIKNMKSKWGHCNIVTKELCFNLQLIKKNKVCLDYIIVHELGHIIIYKHDKSFHKYMNIYFPNWKIVKKQLNN